MRGGQPAAAEDAFGSGLEIGYARYLAKDDQGARRSLITWLGEHRATASQPDVRRAEYLLGWLSLAGGDGRAAAENWSNLDFAGQLELTRAADTLDWPYRSPLLAGLLSIIPGAGHLYLGQPGIAVTALVWNGLFGYGLYDSARLHQVGLALVLGLFEALWYAGTIFGAINGAKKFNRDARLNAVEALRARYDDRPESWPPAPPIPPQDPNATTAR